MKASPRPTRPREGADGAPGAGPTATPRLPCPHYPACVGCPLIGMPYGEQLARKRQSLQSTLRAAGVGEVEVPPVVGSPHAFGYRTQAKLVLRQAKGETIAGIYHPGTHRVADISRCPVHHPLINEVITALCAEIAARDLSVYDERTGRGLLRYAAVRVSAWQRRAQLILVTTERRVPDPASLVRALRRRVHGLASIVQNVNADSGNAIFGPLFAPWTSDASLIERVGDLKLKSRAGAFLQANIPVARRLYTCAAEWAGAAAGDAVADLYCGVGALSFHLARGPRLVVGIEESPPAVLDAKENVRLNGFHNVRFRQGDVATELPALAAQLGAIDVITLNPSRKGASAAARTAILECAPRRIVYVSCEPTSLARDLRELGTSYAIAAIRAFDMFPQTDHVETVVALERRPAGARR